MTNEKYYCPKCSSPNLTAKYESAYVYSYKIDQSEKKPSNEEYNTPFLFEDRQLKYSNEYIVCDDCHHQYETAFKQKSNKVEI